MFFSFLFNYHYQQNFAVPRKGKQSCIKGTGANARPPNFIFLFSFLRTLHIDGCAFLPSQKMPEIFWRGVYYFSGWWWWWWSCEYLVCVCDTEFKWWQQNGLTSQQACCYTEPRSTDMGIAIRLQVKVEASIVSHPWQFQMQIVCKIPERWGQKSIKAIKPVFSSSPKVLQVCLPKVGGSSS